MVPSISSISRVDLDKSLVFVGGKQMPMGSLSTWGFGDTSYLRAMNDPRALIMLNEREGLRDGQSGAGKLFGPRIMPADHKVLTRHGGLTPESIRNSVPEFMGISPREKMMGRAPLGMQLQALTGALYLAGLGATLPELFSDPRRLSVLASSALPGPEKFAESARASGFSLDEKTIKALAAIEEIMRIESVKPFAEQHVEAMKVLDALLKNPVVGRDPILEKKGVINDVMRISHILGSGVATILSNMIGPRSNLLSENPLEGARTLGPEFHHTGECATFLGSVRAGALMLRADPDYFQVPEMVLVGAAEAAFTTPEARLLQFLFDSMGAMEPTDKVFARGADLLTGCAPLTTDVGGFWPGEGAGMVGLTTVRFAMQKRLRILAELTSLGASADQGGKTHPAAIGLGGYNSAAWALKVAGRTGVFPNYTNAHGTGTRNNNEEEAKALEQILGAMHYSGLMNLFADKAVWTHALAAAGALALSGMLFGIVNGVLPGAANLSGRTVDPGINPNIFKVSSDPVRDFVAILLRSQGFWGNNEDMVILPMGEGMLARRYQGINDEVESQYWNGVRERDQKGAETVEALFARRLTYQDFLESVRFA